MTRNRVLFAAGALVAVGSGVALFAIHGAAPRETPPDDAETEGDAAVIAWCAPGLEPIAGGGCLAMASTTSSPKLIIYLHGMYERSQVDQELDRQRRVAARANARGFSVLALRGREGECARPEVTTWFCWPSNERTQQHAPDFVAAWKPALRATEARIGGAPPQRFVLGFSNGAYFAGLLASRDLFHASAFVVALGGPVEPVRAPPAKPPLLLMSADEDESQPEMIRFDAELTHVGWPHEVYARDGVHMLTDGDIEAAITFFVRSQREKIPLTPPLTTHRPSPRRDAAAEASTEEEDAAAPAREEAPSENASSIEDGE